MCQYLPDETGWNLFSIIKVVDSYMDRPLTHSISVWWPGNKIHDLLYSLSNCTTSGLSIIPHFSSSSITFPVFLFLSLHCDSLPRPDWFHLSSLSPADLPLLLYLSHVNLDCATSLLDFFPLFWPLLAASSFGSKPFCLRYEAEVTSMASLSHLLHHIAVYLSIWDLHIVASYCTIPV